MSDKPNVQRLTSSEDSEALPNVASGYEGVFDYSSLEKMIEQLPNKPVLHSGASPTGRIDRPTPPWADIPYVRQADRASQIVSDLMESARRQLSYLYGPGNVQILHNSLLVNVPKSEELPARRVLIDIAELAKRFGESVSFSGLRSFRGIEPETVEEVIKALDGCWCDDGRGYPECEKCVANRVKLTHLLTT